MCDPSIPVLAGVGFHFSHHFPYPWNDMTDSWVMPAEKMVGGPWISHIFQQCKGRLDASLVLTAALIHRNPCSGIVMILTVETMQNIKRHSWQWAQPRIHPANTTLRYTFIVFSQGCGFWGGLFRRTWGDRSSSMVLMALPNARSRIDRLLLRRNISRECG